MNRQISTVGQDEELAGEPDLTALSRRHAVRDQRRAKRKTTTLPGVIPADADPQPQLASEPGVTETPDDDDD